MDPLILGALVGTSTILILFSGISVGIGLLVVSALFIMIFDGAPSLALMPRRSDWGELLAAPATACQSHAR